MLCFLAVGLELYLALMVQLPAFRHINCESYYWKRTARRHDVVETSLFYHFCSFCARDARFLRNPSADESLDEIKSFHTSISAKSDDDDDFVAPSSSKLAKKPRTASKVR